MNLVTRGRWGARSPTKVVMISPTADFVVVHHTAGSPGSTVDYSYRLVRSTQNYHMNSKRYYDIAYNFLFDQHGNIYEGRGWDARNGANRPENQESISVCFLGDSRHHILTPKAKAALVSFMKEARKRGFTEPWKGHRDVSTEGTTCPGDPLYVYINSREFRAAVMEKRYKYTLSQLRDKTRALRMRGWSWRAIKRTKWWRAFKRRGGK